MRAVKQGGGGGSKSERSWNWIHKVSELDPLGPGVTAFLRERATLNFNLDKIIPLRRAKCNSEAICIKKLHLLIG